MPRVRLSRAATKDLDDILTWSAEHFGEPAAGRYAELIAQAIRDLAEDGERPGVRPLPGDRTSLFLYHLAESRDRVSGDRVKRPRHFILFRMADATSLDVLRILHDSRDLLRHVPDE